MQRGMDLAIFCTKKTLIAGMESKEADNAAGGILKSFYVCFISAVETWPQLVTPDSDRNQSQPPFL